MASGGVFSGFRWGDWGGVVQGLVFANKLSFNSVLFLQLERWETELNSCYCTPEEYEFLLQLSETI